MTSNQTTNQGRLTIRTLAMPSDTNPAGDIFCGWVLSQMDLAAGICADQRAQRLVVTAAVESMSFIRPVKVGNILGVYTKVLRAGLTSLNINIEAWVRLGRIGQREKITEAIFRFVAVDDEGHQTPVLALEDLPTYVASDL